MSFPALNIRDAHERPEAMEEASVMMTGMNIFRIEQALELLHEASITKTSAFLPVQDYTKPNVSDKVVRIILSYVDYVKRTVWNDLQLL